MKLIFFYFIIFQLFYLSNLLCIILITIYFILKLIFHDTVYETSKIYNLDMQMTRWKLCKTPTQNFTMINWIMKNKIEMVVNCKPPIKFYDVNKIIDNSKLKMGWAS
jgi:hypothetical protein